MQGFAGEVRRVAIVGGNRIPFARANSRYDGASNQDMLTAALDGLADRFDLAGMRLGEVVAGAVLKHSRDFNLARESVLGSLLSSETPAYDVQQACGTGMQAVTAVAGKIALGVLDVGVAGGVDTATDVPIAVNDALRSVLLEVSHARSPLQRLRAVAKVRPSQLRPDPPRNSEPRTGLSMGEHAALTAVEWEIDRTAQDQLALRSHQRLSAAYAAGFFDDLVTAYRGLTRDESLRPDTTLEKLSRLAPVFGSGATATMTAGNSTPLTDGASVVLLATQTWAADRGLPVLGYLTHHETAAVDYVDGAEGLLMAPAYAMARMLARTGLRLQDFDFYENHEAFASQVLATLAAWEDPIFCRERLGLDEPLGAIDRDRLNVTGSSLAAGHPFAATGGRIVATLAKLLADQAATGHPGGRGVISICAAGGQAVTAIIERS
ncbi:MAG: acetyl-CoA C-acetyltransferase [Propionibacteriales bacterium]|nr:acetyl-CoA C-acetyltransferase [Propionibacteriales bacterium]